MKLNPKKRGAEIGGGGGGGDGESKKRGCGIKKLLQQYELSSARKSYNKNICCFS